MNIQTGACIIPMTTHHSRTANQLVNYHTYIEHSIFQSHYILQRLYFKERIYLTQQLICHVTLKQTKYKYITTSLQYNWRTI